MAGLAREKTGRYWAMAVPLIETDLAITQG